MCQRRDWRRHSLQCKKKDKVGGAGTDGGAAGEATGGATGEATGGAAGEATGGAAEGTADGNQ